MGKAILVFRKLWYLVNKGGESNEEKDEVIFNPRDEYPFRSLLGNSVQKRGGRPFGRRVQLDI